MQLFGMRWVFLIVFLTNCTVTQTRDLEGNSTSSVSIGFTKPIKCGDELMLSAKVVSLGAWLNQSGMGIGVKNDRFACGGTDQCSVVIWLKDKAADIESIRNLVQELDGICIVEE